MQTAYQVIFGRNQEVCDYEELHHKNLSEARKVATKCMIECEEDGNPIPHRIRKVMLNADGERVKVLKYFRVGK